MDLIPGPEITDDLVSELDQSLWMIEGNYHREGAGPGSRFEGQTLQTAQVRYVIRHIWPLAYQAGREDAARDIAEALKACEDKAAATYARRKAQGIDDQAKEWAIRSRTWKSARRTADEAGGQLRGPERAGGGQGT